MPKVVDNGSFACLAFCTRGLAGPAVHVDISESIWAQHGSPFEIDDFWRRNLGEIEISKLAESTIYLTGVSEHKDEENLLKSQLHSIHYGLLLQGTGYNAFRAFRSGMILGGPIVGGKFQVQSVGEMLLHHEPHKVLSETVTEPKLMTANDIAQGINEIYSNQQGTKHLRIRKGFQAYINGTLSGSRHERIHHFVTAIEALILPTQGKIKKQFKARMRYFAGMDPNTEQLLEDLYDLRSAAEHLNPMLPALHLVREEDRHEVANKRTYQAELLAAFAYKKILTNRDFIAEFESDEQITDIWRKPIRDLQEFWGQDRIDLNQISDDINHIGYLDFL